MQTQTHKVIFVHGVNDGPASPDYANGLSALISKHLPKGFSISFAHADYSHIALAERQAVLADYAETIAKQGSWTDKLADHLLFNSLRHMVVSAAGNSLAYEDQVWHNEINKAVADLAQTALDAGDNVTLVGHSLGSVVTLEVALSFGGRVTNLVTMGSPVALFNLSHKNTVIKQASDATKDVVQTNPSVVSRNWLNIINFSDILSYRLEHLYPNLVKDVVVSNSFSPLEAHEAYWQSDDVAKIIAEQLIKNV